MAATVPTTLGVFLVSGVDVRFLMLEESSVLFKINSLLLFSIDSSSVWFMYLQTQTHNELFIVFCIASLIDFEFKDDVMMVGLVTLVGSSIGVSGVTGVDCLNVVCFLVGVVDSNVVLIDVVVTGTHNKRLVGIFLL